MILGDTVVQLADHLCNSVGILQQFAPSGSFAGFEKTASKQPAVTNEGKFNLNMSLTHSLEIVIGFSHLY